jgi:hypothetical protein
MILFFLTTALQRLPITRALQRFFSPLKMSFWWTSIKCFHDNTSSPVHFAAVSRPCSIVVSYYNKVISHFVQVEGYYVETKWSIFESNSRNTFCQQNFCEEGDSIVRKHWSRKRSAKLSAPWTLPFLVLRYRTTPR